jgi:hypothetical protein
MAEKLSNAFGGVTIVQKGSRDLISNGKEGEEILSMISANVRSSSINFFPSTHL